MVRSSSSHRTMALLSAAAGVALLIAAILGNGWGWRGILAASAGVLWLIVAALQFAKARRDNGPRPDGAAGEMG